jgi:hypothetical protein
VLTGIENFGSGFSFDCSTELYLEFIWCTSTLSVTHPSRDNKNEFKFKYRSWDRTFVVVADSDLLFVIFRKTRDRVLCSLLHTRRFYGLIQYYASALVLSSHGRLEFHWIKGVPMERLSHQTTFSLLFDIPCALWSLYWLHEHCFWSNICSRTRWIGAKADSCRDLEDATVGFFLPLIKQKLFSPE